MKKTFLNCLLMVVFAAVASVVADDVQAMDFPEINAEQLKEKLDAGEEMMLLNPLSKIEFEDKHIPGSINIPLQALLVADNLPKDKDHLIVTYCLGRK